MKKRLLMGLLVGLCFGASTVAADDVDGQVYRLYDSQTRTHFYTKNVSEVELLKQRGWKDEGLAWEYASTGDTVYRLYDSKENQHFYTKSVSEVELLKQRGWKDEGLAFRSNGGVPIYRMFNEKSKIHFYTRNPDEYNKASGIGYKKEGVAFYSKEAGADYFLRVQGIGRDRIHFLKKFNEANEFVLLESNGRFALLDAGYQTQSTHDYAIKYLQDLGVQELDFVVLSHYDEDHWAFLNTQQTGYTSTYRWYGQSRGVEETYLGSTALLDNFKIGRVIARPADSKVYYEPRVRKQIETTLAHYGIPITYEQQFSLGDYQLSIFNDYPLSADEIKKGAVSNYNSLAVLVEKDDYNFLFAGDVEEADEPRLASDLAVAGNPTMDLVTAAHHGLGTSNTREYVQAIGSPVAIVSYHPDRVGYGGRQNLPAYEQLFYSGLGTVVADLTDTASSGISVSQPDTGKYAVITK